MNAVRFMLPLLASALAFPSRAQDAVGCVLVVQHGPGDLVPNAPLFDAIVREPQCVDAIRKALGAEAERLGDIHTALPAPHLAGTFQVHISTYLLQSGVRLSGEQQDRVVDAVVGHVRQRLDQMLFAQPSEQCKKRREELTGHLADLLARRAEMQARIDGATVAGSEVAQRRNALEQQLVAARLDLATQQGAQAQIEKLRAQYTDVRAQRRAESERVAADKAVQLQRVEDIKARLRDLADGPKTDLEADELRKLRVDYQESADRVRAANAAVDATNAGAEDAQRMLTVILEQLPPNTIALQRAHARLDALAAEQKQLQVFTDTAAKARTDAAHFDTQAERVAIEISVTKTMLTEIEGKLARLQPVRYELLRRHQ